MTANFDDAWNRITSELSRGTIVKNWGGIRGYTGRTFEIVTVERTAVTVAGGRMRMPRRVARSDFEKIYAVWAQYVTGNFPREKTTDLSQNTTYIFSILRHFGL